MIMASWNPSSQAFFSLELLVNVFFCLHAWLHSWPPFWSRLRQEEDIRVSHLDGLWLPMKRGSCWSGGGGGSGAGGGRCINLTYILYTYSRPKNINYQFSLRKKDDKL
jgi:hypothetical protein